MQKVTTYRSLIMLFAALVVCNIIACKKFVDIQPPVTTISSGNVYNNDATAIAAITNIYVDISKRNLPGGGITSLSLFPALSADELSLYSAVSNTPGLYYYRNALTSSNLNNPDFWTVLYQTIFAANNAIEGISAATNLTPVVKQQLSGEAKFTRAFCYFYLVNLYGDVPVAAGTDYTVNATLFPSTGLLY